VTVVATQVFSDPILAHLAHWLSIFAAEWHQDLPMHIHTRAIDSAGAPQWHEEFARWLTRDGYNNPRNPDGRLRVTRAMRLLRKAAPRQYEVLYRIMVLGESIESTTAWLNARAIRGGHPERYRQGDTLVILQSSVDWIEYHY
jgi:hypothetical protein